MKFFNQTVEAVEPKEIIMYTEDQLMARLKFFIGICLALTLVGIVFVVLFSLIFVTQPMDAISPMDQKFFELIIPIATFLTGTLSGIMLAGGDKDLQAKALDAANKAPTVSPSPSPVGSGAGFKFNSAPATPSTFGSAPTPASGMALAPSVATAAPATPVMSSTGKPMPIQDPEPEL
jgi:hypothetical protein